MCSCSGGNEKMDKAGCAEAFAEAYGLVRWFYPGDIPEGFDWNEFALYGMREVLECEDVEELEMTLTGLRTQMNMEDGSSSHLKTLQECIR